MEHQKLHADVRREDGSYWAEIRELPGCLASGASIDELVVALEEAVALYVTPSDGEPPTSVVMQLAGLELSVEPDRPLGAA
jgi:predicted RNase H-like HicB family nuclease